MSRVAIVTGVSRGLGAALAADLLARGYAVLGIGRHDMPGAGHARYRFVAADLADVASLDDALALPFAALAHARPTHATLVNNAAMADPVGVFGTLSGAALGASLAVNLAAPAALANLFCRVFADPACDRRIINVSSGAAESTLRGAVAYCAAKAGLEMLTRAIAADHPGSTLVCLTLRPGIIDTQMQVFMRSHTAEALPSVDLFRGFHDGGQLVDPATVARKTVDRLVEGPVEAARTYRYGEL